MRLARLAPPICLALALAGCSGKGPDVDPEPGSTAPGAEVGDAPAPDFLEGMDWVDEPLAPGELELVRTVPRPRYKERYGTLPVGVTFTEELVLFGDTRAQLGALDRASGKVRWRVPMESSLPGGDSVCSIAVPSATAEVVVLNHGAGWVCGDFTAYDLATGKVRDSYSSVSELGDRVGSTLASNEAVVEFGDRYYWVDSDARLRRLEDDGSSSIIGNLRLLLRAQGDFVTQSFLQIPGSDVFLIRFVPLTDFDSDDFRDTFMKENDDGIVLGFRLDENGVAQRLWQQRVPDLASRTRSPGHKYGSFSLPDFLPGSVLDTQVRNGRKFIRVRPLDPQTGELVARPGLRVPYDGLDKGGPGLPALVQEYGGDNVLAVGDETVVSPYEVPKRVGDTSVVRLDLRTGRELWRWQLPGGVRALSPPQIDVVSISPDRSSVLARSALDFDNRLWQLDLETGEAVAQWQLPEEKPMRYDLDGAVVAVDGSDVVLLNPVANAGSKVIAALLRAPGAPS